MSLAEAARSIIFVAAKQVFCHDKSMLVTTKHLSHKHNFDMTKVLSWQAYFCCDKTFVATKMILVAAPTSDSFLPQ